MDNVYTAIKPFYAFVKVLGMFPMTFQGHVINGNFKTKRSDVVSTCLSFLFFILLCCARTRDGIKNCQLTPTLSRILWEATFAFILSMLLAQFGLQIHKRNEIEKFLKQIHNFDNEVKKICLSRRQRFQLISFDNYF